MAGEVQQKAVKEAQEMLEKIQETSGAGALEAIPESAAPESTTEADRSEAAVSGNPSDPNLAKLIQISDSPTIISPPSSSISDSDHDNMTLSHRINMLPKPTQKPKPFESVYPVVLQRIGELSQSQIDICNRLLDDHPFQPLIIEPLNMIPADTHTSTSTQPPIRNNPKPTQTTLQEGQSSAAAEDSEAPEEPNTTDLPHCDSPTNLFSLEKHLGGELIATPQKATKSVLEMTDLVNQ